MTNSIIYFPSDQEIKIQINNADETAFNLSVASDITVILFQQKDKQIQEYKKSTEGDIDLTSASDGILKVKLDRKNSEDCIEDVLLAEVEIVIDDENYEDGKKKIRVGQIEVANMVKSAM